MADHGEYKNDIFISNPSAYFEYLDKYIFIDQFIISQYICRCYIYFNNRLNFVWVLTHGLMDIISLLIV
jgi:hypothetical protein